MKSDLKVASFTAWGSQEQAIRWKRAAEAEGFRSVGVWLARAADAYLRVRAKAGIPMPLAWHQGRFSVNLLEGQTVELRGMISPPFAYFRGDACGPNIKEVYTLAHLTEKRIIASLRTARQARTLAAELAPVYARDDASAIVERHRQESV